MKHSAFSVTSKANNKVCKGNSWHSYDPVKLTCQNHIWRQCTSLSLISRILFTFISFHKA